mgnify:FL=1
MVVDKIGARKEEEEEEEEEEGAAGGAGGAGGKSISSISSADRTKEPARSLESEVGGSGTNGRVSPRPFLLRSSSKGGLSGTGRGDTGDLGEREWEDPSLNSPATGWCRGFRLDE